VSAAAVARLCRLGRSSKSAAILGTPVAMPAGRRREAAPFVRARRRRQAAKRERRHRCPAPHGESSASLRIVRGPISQWRQPTRHVLCLIVFDHESHTHPFVGNFDQSNSLIQLGYSIGPTQAFIGEFTVFGRRWRSKRRRRCHISPLQHCSALRGR
jgi:hypothetical protein